jgi:hypothetical protein
VVLRALVGTPIEEAGTLRWEHADPNAGSVVPRSMP